MEGQQAWQDATPPSEQDKMYLESPGYSWLPSAFPLQKEFGQCKSSRPRTSTRSSALTGDDADVSDTVVWENKHEN